MATLLLRLAAPFQSWGVDSKLDIRTSGREPSKSGVIGMVASALGRTREDSITDLSELRFAVRVDQVGTMMKDFHMVHSKDSSYLTYRYYLQDACFVVGLEGDRALLVKIVEAIQNPAYPLYLGRRSCPPVGKIIIRIDDAPLEEAVRECPWQAAEWYRRRQPRTVDLEIVCDSDIDTCDGTVNDMPLTFSQKRRRFAPRGVRHEIAGKTIDNPDSRKSEEYDYFFAVKKEVS